jgi:hypothetical protein
MVIGIGPERVIGIGSEQVIGIRSESVIAFIGIARESSADDDLAGFHRL